MEFKDLFTPKTVNMLSYVAVLLWVLLEVVCAIFLDMEINESRFDFRCDVKSGSDKDFIRGKCFDQYQKKFIKLGIPLYAFVIVNFLSISTVFLVYSQCVKSTVNRLKGALRDAEWSLRNPRRGRSLFFAYLSQLATKFSLGIMFIVFLETDLLYPKHFPADFTCLVKKEGNDSGKLVTNQTQSTLHECISQRAMNKNFWINAVTVVNGITAFFAFVEIVWILSRAKRGITFMDNTQFYIDHLRSNLCDQQQETPQEEIPLAEVESGCQPAVQEAVGIQYAPSSLNTGEAEEGMPHSELAREQLEQTEAIKFSQQLDDLKQPFRRKPGEGPNPNDLKTDQIYVNVAIHEGRAFHVFAKNRREQLKQYPPDSKDCLYAKPDDLIDKQHRNVLVVGRPGVGKTLLSAKILRMWASGEAFNRDQADKIKIVVVFFINVKRLTGNLVLSLRELLTSAETVEHLHETVWDFLIKNPSRVLFIFDGVDEFSAKADISRKDHTYY